jgi:hypothetical protein
MIFLGLLGFDCNQSCEVRVEFSTCGVISTLKNLGVGDFRFGFLG